MFRFSQKFLIIIHEILLFIKMDISWSWRRQTLKIHQFSCTPLLSRTATHGILLSRFLENIEESLQKSKLWPYFFLFPSLRFLITSWTTWPVPEVYILVNSSPFVLHPIEHLLSLSPWSSVSRMCLQHSPKMAWFSHCCSVFATYIVGLQVSHKT